MCILKLCPRARVTFSCVERACHSIDQCFAMDQTNSLLISSVQGYPHLYNKADPSYKDAIMCQNSWTEISQIVNMQVEDCQVRWKSLRDRYCREKKKISTLSSSGAVRLSSSSLQLLKDMNFLDEFIRHRRTLGKFSQSSSFDSWTEDSSGKPLPSASPCPHPSSSPRPHLSPSPLPHPSSSLCPLPCKLESSSSPPQLPLSRTFPSCSAGSPRPSHSAAPSPEYKQSPDQQCFDSFDESEDTSFHNWHEEYLEDDVMKTEEDPADVNHDPLDLEVPSPVQPRMKKRKRAARNLDVNEAIISALSGLQSVQKSRQESTLPNSERQFIESLGQELMRFAPRKRNMVKGEIMLLLSKHDYSELP